MKVLDLQCRQLHLFEGWFASEEDYLSQHDRGLVACPVCGDCAITKRLSAPRLNLSSGREVAPQAHQEVPGDHKESELQAALMTVARHLVANTDDVGDRFATEARKIHYGEVKARGIRGQTSPAEALSLLDEGIAVLPFAMPEALKGPLQ
jgi:hypothetical protein